MSAIVDRKAIITTKDGTQFQCEASDKIENRTQCQVICDGPKCDVRHKAEAQVSFEFCQEDVATSIDAYPEIGDSFMSVVLPPRSPSFGDGQPKAFCSSACLKDFLSYVYAPPPPRPVQKADKVFEASVEKNSELLVSLVDKITPENLHGDVWETADGGRISREDVMAPELAYQRGLAKLPSAEDLDEAVRQPSIPGVTAAVSDATGFAGEQ